MYLIIFLLLFPQTLANNDSYKITKFNNFQGIYFEELDPITFERGQVTAHTEINLEKLRFGKKTQLEDQLNLIMQNCKGNMNCTRNLDSIECDIKELGKSYRELMKFLASIVNTAVTPYWSLLISNNL